MNKEDFEKKLEEAKRLREATRKRLQDADELVKRLDSKLSQLKKSRIPQEDSGNDQNDQV